MPREGFMYECVYVNMLSVQVLDLYNHGHMQRPERNVRCEALSLSTLIL